MQVIDGSQGEGGGQIVRTSLALAALTQRAVRISNLRAKRSRPGLMRQHLAAVRAAAAICNAEVTGDELGSSEITFHPNEIAPGDYQFGVDTAGSTTLILQTVLPALITAAGPSKLTLRGGTHNPFAPPVDFLQRAYLPLINRMGPQVTLTLLRAGFFPAGGGEFVVEIQPSAELRGFDLLDRGELVRREVRALVSNLPVHIAERECRTIAAASGWPEDCFRASEVANTIGPGNVVMIELDYEHVTELFVGFGQKGIRAEVVAERAWQEAAEYISAGVPVGVHLADQLLLPFSLAAQAGQGGSFRTLEPTQHSLTHIDVLRKFLDVDIGVQPQSSNDVVVSIR